MSFHRALRIFLAITATGGGLFFGWGWLVAIGLAPCLLVCALGICMARRGGVGRQRPDDAGGQTMMAQPHGNRRSPTVAPIVAALAAGVVAAAAATGAEQGDPSRGARVFRACAACHSLEADKSMTGPSLAGMWDRKAGRLASFVRYSPALKSSGVTWDAQTLDPWLKEPEHFIPGNRMTFAGIADDRARHDLIAYLKEATAADHPAPGPPVAQNDGMGGMMGGSQTVPSLKKLDPGDRVTAIAYCGDTYRVTTEDGETHEFWERNLRLKTDSSSDGPEKNAPAILGAGMMGDRASIVFSTPEEVSAAIKRSC